MLVVLCCRVNGDGAASQHSTENGVDNNGSISSIPATGTNTIVSEEISKLRDQLHSALQVGNLAFLQHSSVHGDNIT